MPSDSSLPIVEHLGYLDFKLEINHGSGREYPVAVIRSPAGRPREAKHSFFDNQSPYIALGVESRISYL